MIKINPREANALSFEMKIDGAIKSIDSVSLLIDTKQGFQLKVPAKYVNETVECQLPVLANLLEAGEHQFALEVVVDGKVFTPLNESFEVEAPLSITAQISESVKQHVEEVKEEPTITVKKSSLSQMILKGEK